MEREEISTKVTKAFAAFISNTSSFALPLVVIDETLQVLSPLWSPEDSGHTFQQALNQLDTVISTKTPLYLILRYKSSFVATTFVPYAANAELKMLLLDNRQILVEALEIGEITDARSWEERSGKGQSWNGDHDEHADMYKREDATTGGVHDLGHKKNKCRLCDRRMKNNIDDAAVNALRSLAEGGDCVQSVNISTEILQLNVRANNLPSADVASRLPTDKPSFTFYRHSSSDCIYFVFCSPDSAHVKERMKHTMAIPGLINIIAKDNGVNVHQKLEIHVPEEMDFEPKDERIGKFRSMYLRNRFAGTESQ
ncbi:hypothetical protein PMIN04_011280 [Paraphaeosphaeria minitans]